MEIMNTFWALVPAIIAIVIALLTKEVYASLFFGILLGALLISDFNILDGFTNIFKLFSQGIGFDTNNPANSDPYNFTIVIFLVLLGILVVLVNKSGGSHAFGIWSSNRIKTRKGVLGATIGLGALISVDDYFNNLTVSSVMVPVTDRHKISRVKLAYFVSSVAAPICIICPLSSWAVTVSGVISNQGMNGFGTFLKTIPYNLYAILTIVMLILFAITGFDFGKMKKIERSANEGNDISLSKDNEGDVLSKLKPSQKGKTIDLIIPVIILIVSSILFMLYTGGLFDGSHTILEAFGECASGVSLCCGALIAIVTCGIMYLPRKVMSIKDFTSCFVEGFRSMAPAIMILVLAWTLNCVCQNLGINNFVDNIVSRSGMPLALIPAIFFLFALGLAYATGTSWGTFSILIPLVISILNEDPTLTIIGIASVLSGSVCGDHVSLISDTTILASTGSKCDHVMHVAAQMPYCLVVAGASFVGFLLGGFIKNVYLIFLVSLCLLISSFFLINIITKKKEEN